MFGCCIHLESHFLYMHMPDAWNLIMMMAADGFGEMLATQKWLNHCEYPVCSYSEVESDYLSIYLKHVLINNLN